MKKLYLYLSLLVMMALFTGVAGAASKPSCPIIPQFRGVTYVICPPYNVVGDGEANDTAAFQAAINAAPDFSTIVIPTGVRIRTTATINIISRLGLKIIGGGSNGQSGLDRNGGVIYDGANDAPVINVDGSRDLTFENFSINANNKANVGIQFKSVSGTQAVTFNNFRRIAVWAGASPRPSFIGIDICGTGTMNNCELFQMREVNVNSNNSANSVGIRIGHANSLAHLVSESTVTNSAIGIQNLNGSVRITGNLFDANTTDIYSATPDSVIIEFNRTENSKQFLRSTDGRNILIGNRFGSPDPVPLTWLDFTGSGSATTQIMIGNVFSGDPFTEVVPYAGGSGMLFSMGNLYDARSVNGSKQVTAMATFANEGYVSLSDVTTDGNRVNPEFNTNEPLIASTLKTTGAATGKKVVCVDTTTGQLYASSTGTDCSN